MNAPVQIRTALLSVSDKTDLVPFASALAKRGVKLVSTGGTAKALAAAGLSVVEVGTLTGFPEGLDGRVKTLHPKVHGGLLAVRDNPEHMAFLRTHGIDTIDLLCINLYPFEQTVAREGVSLDEAIEQIDVGGPAMLRAAAKNFRYVTVVCSPRRYDTVIAELDAANGATGLETRARLAAEVFAHTADYDAAIAAHLAKGAGAPGAVFPQELRLSLARVDELRYGENPHQAAALYRNGGHAPAGIPTVVGARQLHGKELSYNNINDASAALELVRGLHETEPSRASACVVKHLSPCGAAISPTGAVAIDRAIAGDPIAAYGGILACSARIDLAAAQRIAAEGTFFEVVIAPEFADDALAVLRARWTGVRLLACGAFPGPDGAPRPRELEFRSVPGGMLVQERDTRRPTPSDWQHRAGPKPGPETLRAAAMLEVVGKAALSNAVVIGGVDGESVRLFGLGGGQVDRLTSCRLAVAKAGETLASEAVARAGGAVAFSDAFFPFDDGPRVLVEAGVRTIVHPGGSKRDDETFTLCEQSGVACFTTGTRHFRH